MGRAGLPLHRQNQGYNPARRAHQKIKDIVVVGVMEQIPPLVWSAYHRHSSCSNEVGWDGRFFDQVRNDECDGTWYPQPAMAIADRKALGPKHDAP